MLSNIRYRISLFADYSNIFYNNENSQRLIKQFADEDMFCMILPESDVLGNVRHGLLLSNRANTFTVAIMSGRIDITIISENKEGFIDTDVDSVKKKLIIASKEVYSAFEGCLQDAYRFAWYTEYIYFEIGEDEKDGFRSRFIKKIDCLSGNETSEFAVQYAALDHATVCERDEKFNLIIGISRLLPIVGNSNQVDGFKISFDINTHQDTKRNRISSDNLKEYVNAAIGFQVNLKGGFLDGCA